MTGYSCIVWHRDEGLPKVSEREIRPQPEVIVTMLA